MTETISRLRVLYSFPLRLGADRVCYTAWQQVSGLAAADVDLLVFPASLARPVARNARVQPTLARGRVRLPYKIVGTMRAVALHDWIVARRLEKLAGQIDVIHTWPLGALETLKVAKRLGIPTLMERPNAHTRFAMEVVQQECDRLGVALPPDHEHAYNAEKLEREEAEYELSYRLLCPSDFVAGTFLDRGFPREKLARHSYGFDSERYHARGRQSESQAGLTMLFVGVCAVRKGVHFALEAWLRSPASQTGQFFIAGEFLKGYEEKLAPMLSHPSVRVLGHRKDVDELMRKADILVLPSIEEGSALVTAEARGCGCVLVVSDASGANCTHMEDALVHHAGDVATLAQHITTLHQDRQLLETLRAASLRTVGDLTWKAAGHRLLDAYMEAFSASRVASQDLVSVPL
jgi:glycosyltransferase involved in cell wall biosynthesis